MQAVTISDGALLWRDHPDPEPGHGEMLVAVRAAGLNGADMLQRQGLYPPPPGAPADVPGLELAGEVIATGPATSRFSVGDAVMAVVAGGGQAERACVHERTALPIPEGVGWPEAGGFPEAFTTAHDALFTQCGLTLGERVLIHGAAGGVGIAAVQLAARAGARVVATVRNEELRAGVAEIGVACGSVDVCAPDAFADRGPYDVVLELVGAPNVPDDLGALATGGRIAVIAAPADVIPRPHPRFDAPSAPPRREGCGGTRGRALRAPVAGNRGTPRADRCRVPDVGRRGRVRAVRRGGEARQGRAPHLSRLHLSRRST